MHSMPWDAWSVLRERAFDVRITPTPGVTTRACRSVLLALLAHVDYLAHVDHLDSDDLTGTFPGTHAIAAHAEMSVRTARRALRALETTGLVVVDPGATPRTRRFQIMMGGAGR